MTAKERLHAGETLLGAFLGLGSPVAAELCTTGGFDWLLVDLEHGWGGEADLRPQLQALSGGDAAPLVRVPRSERAVISRALDAGAHGVMVPRIDTADEARAAASYMRYPPGGVRGVASSTRGSLFAAEEQREPLGIIQIESETAVANAREIAELDGVDVLFVGPSDLSAAMGVGVTDPRVDAAYDAVVEAARGAGKAPGVFAKGRPVDEFVERGFRFIAVGSDTSFLLAGMKASAPAARE